MEFIITSADGAHDRIDRYLQRHMPEVSRSRLQDLIKDGHATLNGKHVKPSAELRPGDTLQIEIPEPVSVEVVAQDIPLDVLYEDEHLIVINKASGLVVHPAAGNPDGTLVNALLHHCDDLSGIGGEMRPGIVHRLDKDTSGCMVIAKHDRAHTQLSEHFAQRLISKLYLAVVNGLPKTSHGRLENSLGRHPVDRKRMAVLYDGTGKTAVTEWNVISTHKDTALILCRLLTGRTHQIRVHMRDCLQSAILGDVIYGNPPRQNVKTPRLMLHAWRLAFQHPITHQPLSFCAPVPVEYEPWLPDASVLESAAASATAAKA